MPPGLKVFGSIHDMGSIPKEFYRGWDFGQIKKIVTLFEIAPQFDIILVSAVSGY
jgi:hypothetical protein